METTKIQKFSALAFVLLFPGAFFYHVGTGLGYIPHVLAGYISVTGALALSIFMVNSIFSTSRSLTVNKHDLAFYIFIVAFGAISAFSYMSDYQTENAKTNFLLFINLFTCFYIFKNINLTDESFKKTIIVSTLLMSAAILYFSSGGRFSIELLSDDPERVANYQTFALAYICPLTLTISKIKSDLHRHLVFALGMTCLYLNSARSEFVAIVIFFLVFEATVSKYRVMTPIVAMMLATLVLVTIIFIEPEVADNRVTQLLNLSEDESSNVRNQISKEGFKKILESPVLGDYGNYEPGYYIHNALSAWQELGIFGFVYFCWLIYSPTKRFTINALKYGDRSRGTALCLGMLAAIIVLLIFGKYFAYPLVAVTLGMVSSELKAKSFIARQSG